MLVHTTAFSVLKARIKETFDFAVLVCHAVPALNAYMKAVAGGGASKLPDPHYFKITQSNGRLKSSMVHYRKSLGRIIFLSSFTYFEAYIKDAVQEIIDFHGGADVLIASLRDRNLASIRSSDPQTERFRRQLNEQRKKNWGQRYEKAQGELTGRGYRFPSDLLSSFGVRQLISVLKNMKAADIPEVLEAGLLLELEAGVKERFSQLRDQRNDIAHGRGVTIELAEAIAANQHLRELAMKVDAHIVRHFLILETHRVRSQTAVRETLAEQTGDVEIDSGNLGEVVTGTGGDTIRTDTSGLKLADGDLSVAEEDRK